MIEIQESREGDVLVYSLKGRLDSQTYHEMEREMETWLAAGTNHLVGDLSQLDYISSAGLRVLLLAAKKLAGRGGRMGLCSPQEHVKEVFDITGVSDIIPITGSKEEALKAIEGP